MAESRKEEEKTFHNRLRTNAFGQRWSPDLEDLIQNDRTWNNMKYYAIERNSRQAVLSWFIENTQGKKVLDYCCGNGDDSFFLAKGGASEIIGIDISEVSINNCRDRAKKEGVSNKVSFLGMDAEQLRFDSNSFDVVTEYGALHHLNLQKAYAEIARILKPEGKAICVEALGHNPLIHNYRKKTPHLRTQWEVEHILRKKDIYLAKEYFHQINVLGFYHLATLAAVPLRNFRTFNLFLTTLEWIDKFLLSLPGIKWQAWQIVFVLSQPKKINR